MISRLFIIVILIAVITAESTTESSSKEYDDGEYDESEEQSTESTTESSSKEYDDGEYDESEEQSTEGLNDMETKENDIFLKYKSEELATGVSSSWMNAAGLHFSSAKPLIDNSKIFKILQKMPKGALLHTHNLGSVSSKGLIEAIGYIPGLRRCTRDQEGGLNILSFRELKVHNCFSGYGIIKDERIYYEKEFNITNYDEMFERILNLDIIDVKNASANRVWSAVENLETTLSDAIRYLPAFRAYHRQFLEELYCDKVMYAELRLRFDELYDNNTKAYPVNQTVIELIDVVENFKLEHSDFLGIKMIYAASRSAGIEEIRKEFELCLELQSSYPDYVICFDLVGREDNGNPINNFLDVFKDSPNSKYFFNDDLYGASENLDLFDDILSNTPRIGNGFTLTKHPMLLETVINRDIAVEVCPISSQMFYLVKDLRNHTGRVLFSKNVSMVIGNDYPGFWHAKGLSYDFYYAIMSWAPNNAGLKTLKELVCNSIKYSMLDSEEKVKAYKQLETKWDEFIDNVFNDEESVNA